MKKANLRKTLSVIMAVSLIIGLFAMTSLTAGAASGDGPIRVSAQPISATYLKDATAAPLTATFSYDTSNEPLMPDWDGTLRVQWYWSLSNSNTDRSHGLGETVHAAGTWYSRTFDIPTSFTPPTDTVGVWYYFAVMSYYVRPALAAVIETARETVTNTARIEVFEPEVVEHEFTVRKVDEDGAPLAGAVFSLIPQDAQDSQDLRNRTYEATSGSNGLAVFTAGVGLYTLLETRAPPRHNPSNDSYNISIAPNGVYIFTENSRREYTTITYVNYGIPELNDKDHFAYMQGYPEGDFRPSNNMTRAEAVVMFSRLLMEAMGTTTNYRTNTYPDVPATAWYSNEVGYMDGRNVLVDYCRDGNFRPNEPVTRAEFATLASHFAELELTSTNSFTDVPDDHWAVKYINSAAAKGWIIGYGEEPNRTFMPEGNMTRAEVVTLVNRMVNRHGDNDYLTANASSLPRTFWDLSNGHWAYLDIMEAATGHDYRINSGLETWTGVYE